MTEVYAMTAAILVPMILGYYSKRRGWPTGLFTIGTNLALLPSTVLIFVRPMPALLFDALTAVAVSGVLLVCYAIGRAARFVCGSGPSPDA
jgi:hypothetical protein